MASRASLNKVLLIGNLTRDPELRYTPSGAAVCSFSVATNRVYTASDGTKREEAEFIRIVAWNKLAELCSQLLTKGRKVYVEGRLQTRTWETPDGVSKQTTEVVIDDMRILDSRRNFEEGGTTASIEETNVPKVPETSAEVKPAKPTKPQKTSMTSQKSQSKEKNASDQSASGDSKVDLDDLPF